MPVVASMGKVHRHPKIRLFITPLALKAPKHPVECDIAAKLHDVRGEIVMRHFATVAGNDEELTLFAGAFNGPLSKALERMDFRHQAFTWSIS